MTVSDEDVARKVQAGDTEGFGELVERYQDKLMRYARKFLLDPDDAKDIVQDIFIKTYENMQSFDPARRFSPWIYRIAHNEFVNALKKKSASHTVFAFDIDTLLPHLAAPETADSASLERDVRRTLEGHLDKVGAKYREPLILYYLEEMDYKEISDILQKPLGTVATLINRAKKQLKKTIKEKGIEFRK